MQSVMMYHNICNKLVLLYGPKDRWLIMLVINIVCLSKRKACNKMLIVFPGGSGGGGGGGLRERELDYFSLYL